MAGAATDRVSMTGATVYHTNLKEGGIKTVCHKLAIIAFGSSCRGWDFPTRPIDHGPSMLPFGARFRLRQFLFFLSGPEIVYATFPMNLSMNTV